MGVPQCWPHCVYLRQHPNPSREWTQEAGQELLHPGENPGEHRTVQSPSLTPPWFLQGSRKLLLQQDNGLLRGKAGGCKQQDGQPWFSSWTFSLKPKINRGSFNVPAFTKKRFSLVHRDPEKLSPAAQLTAKVSHRDSQLDLPMLQSIKLSQISGLLH